MTFTLAIQEEIIAFAQQLVQIKSYSGHEQTAIECVMTKMHELGFDEVKLDAMGNVLGRVGHGAKTLLFDSHIDTVEVNDEAEWEFPPFSGIIQDGRLHGRGSVDMKSSVATSIYAAALAKQMNVLEGKTIYVSVTVFEEDCDGENLKHLFQEFDLRPDFVVICEPSSNQITLGHKGKAQVAIQTHGISAHGAEPQKGVNAIYEMAEIIQRVEATNAALQPINGVQPTLVLSRISSVSASLNAVPSECEIYLDRRLAPNETETQIHEEMNRLIEGKNASWTFGTLQRTSWTGLPICYEPFHLAWKIENEHELTQLCISAFQNTFDKAPERFEFWNFSTNAVTPVSLGIPTIGFGCGDYRIAHARNESCAISEIVDACWFYVRLISVLSREA